MSLNQERTEAMLNVVAEIVRNDDKAKIYTVTKSVMELAKIARSLRKRYENMCNYQWANTEKYEKATDKLESKAVKIGEEIGVSIGLQRDPRGWPIIVKSGTYESRLG